MYLSKFAALASLFVAVVHAEIDSNCSSVATVFVTVTATPVTKPVSIPFEVSPSIASKHAVPPKLQVALDTSTDITATLTDYVTLIHVVTTAVPTISTPAVAEKGPYYYTAHNGTTVWLGGKTPPAGVPLSTSTAVVTIKPIPSSSGLLSGGNPEPTIYSTVFLTLISKVYETETLTKTALAVTNSSAVTISSSVSVSSFNNTPSASPVQLVGTVSSAATASLISTTLSRSFTGLGLSGWNATFRTLLKENIVGTANEPAKLLSQQTGVKDNLVTRPGTASGLAVPSRSSNATNDLGARRLAVTNSAAVTISSSVSVPSFNNTPSASPVQLVGTVSSAATASLISTTLSRSFTGLGLSGWNATFRTLLKENIVGTANEPAKLLSQQTGVKDNLVTRPGTANEPAKLLSQQTGVKDNLVTRPGTASGLAVPSCSSNATNNLGVRQLGSIVVATINGVVVSWKNDYDGAALTTQAPVAIASDAAPKDDLVVTSAERNAVPVYAWNLQPVPVQVFPTSSFSWSKISSFEPPRSQTGVPSSVPTDFPDTLVSSLSGIQQPAPTTIITSVVPVLSVLPASSTTASTLSFSNTSSASKSAVTATPSCTGKAKFTINFDDLPHFSTSGDEVDIPPIFNPYRKLFFEDHYGYVPPPSDPFPPISPPQLAVYRANQGLNVDGSPDAGLESVGEFGAGPRASDSAYWIDAFSLWLGCENVGPSDCVITINGYNSAHSTRVVSKTVTQPPCPGLVNCKLALVEFTDDFRNLAGIQILAAVDRKLTAYYIDDVSLGWSNNTCAAQKKRSSAR